MIHLKKTTRLFHNRQRLACVLAALLMLAAGMAMAASPSKRIEIWPLENPTYRTRPGDTLSGIAHRLMPGDPARAARLAARILHDNPQAFVDGDRNRLLAGKILRLPVYTARPGRPAGKARDDTGRVEVERFSWGSIKRRKRPGGETGSER